jgi:hypothetical protein
MADQDLILFLVFCLAICCSMIWQMNRSHRAEVDRLQQLRESDARARELADKWNEEGMPPWVKGLIGEVRDWRAKADAETAKTAPPD